MWFAAAGRGIYIDRVTEITILDTRLLVGSDEDAGETGDESSTAADGSWLVLPARGPEVE
jgi:hypothetical protein